MRGFQSFDDLHGGQSLEDILHYLIKLDTVLNTFCIGIKTGIREQLRKLENQFTKTFPFALKADPRFADREERKRNRIAINAEIGPALLRRNATEWEKLMIEAGIPAGRVLSVPEILGHPHLAGRNFISTFDAPSGEQKITRGGFIFSGDEAAPSGAAPTLSEHTDHWLQKLGYDATAIHELRHHGVI
ncbi:MAG: hypothetical protein PVS2B2_19090 [Candidatus Acidiferrum sp.]